MWLDMVEIIINYHWHIQGFLKNRRVKKSVFKNTHFHLDKAQDINMMMHKETLFDVTITVQPDKV